MKSNLLRLCAALLALCFVNLACYNTYRIGTDQLEQLSSGMQTRNVQVQTDEGSVGVSPTTPITIETSGGDRYSISPFNFTLTERQLVAPDYDLLVARDDIAEANVYEFAKGKTIGLIIGSVVLAAGSFAAISILAPADRELGQ